METVSLSSQTLEIMKNFSNINPSIFIRAGSVLDTLSISNQIMGKASIAEIFPDDVPIYEFNKFLNQLTLYSEPMIDIDGDNDCLYIRDNDPDKQAASTRWIFSDPSIIHRPLKTVSIPDSEIRFDLPADKITSLFKAAGILNFDMFQITRIEQNKIALTILDLDVTDGTHFRFEMDAEIDDSVKDFNLIFNIDNLKILALDYSVAISKKLYSHWFNQTVEYFIAVDKRSTVK